MKNHDQPEAQGLKRWGLIIWPAFLAACLLEVLVFSMIDPGEIHWPGLELQASRKGVYTVAFFMFWFIAVISNGLVLWLAEPDAINQ
ncbi:MULTISPECIES: hypothetical protein [Polaromonas]|uniref:DUF1648 domain-containing protein n=1 Tax=Polaromonas aquatica TaxID=332657 RepID=A0ABW1TUK7_9BURK